MTSSKTTAAATHGVRWSSARPPRPSTSTICSVAYATDESGSEQNTGRASRFGSSVSPRRSLRSGLPSSTRDTVAGVEAMLPFYSRDRARPRILTRFLTAGPRALMLP